MWRRVAGRARRRNAPPSGEWRDWRSNRGDLQEHAGSLYCMCNTHARTGAFRA
jgi:hypothetical protein